jgi:molybdopterin converting factor small subunit
MLKSRGNAAFSFPPQTRVILSTAKDLHSTKSSRAERGICTYHMDMTVQVLLFAQYADALGPSISVEVPEGATVSSLLDEVRARATAIGRQLPQAALAVNQRYARATDVVRANDELAVIPPVAGG